MYPWVLFRAIILEDIFIFLFLLFGIINFFFDPQIRYNSKAMPFIRNLIILFFFLIFKIYQIKRS